MTGLTHSPWLRDLAVALALALAPTASAQLSVSGGAADLNPHVIPRAISSRIAVGDDATALLAAAVFSEIRSGRRLAPFDLATLTEQLEQRLEFADITTLDTEARFERFLCGSALLSSGGDQWRRWRSKQRQPLLESQRYAASFQGIWDQGAADTPFEVSWATTAATILWGFILLADPLPGR